MTESLLTNQEFPYLSPLSSSSIKVRFVPSARGLAGVCRLIRTMLPSGTSSAAMMRSPWGLQRPVFEWKPNMDAYSGCVKDNIRQTESDATVGRHMQWATSHCCRLERSCYCGDWVFAVSRAAEDIAAVADVLAAAGSRPAPRHRVRAEIPGIRRLSGAVARLPRQRVCTWPSRPLGSVPAMRWSRLR